MRKAWLDYYIETGNAAEAARRAGYSEKNANRSGHRILKDKEIQIALKEAQEKRAKKSIATAIEVEEFLTSVMRDDQEETRERLKASELLGKRFGMFKDTVEITEMPKVVDDI